MKTLIFTLALFFGLLFSAQAQRKHLPLQDLLKDKKVSLSARGKGGYFGERLLLTIENLSTGLLLGKVEAGTIFKSKDEGIQDLMILKDYEFVVQRGASKVLTVHTACIQLQNGGPYKNAVYTFDRIGNPEKLGKIARTIAEKNVEKEYISQSSVWCVSNDRDVRFLAHPKKEVFEALARAVCHAQGKDFESLEFKRQESLKPTYVYQGYTKLFLEKDEKLSLKIYKPSGEFLKDFFENVNHPAGFYYRSLMTAQKFAEEDSLRAELVNAEKKVLWKGYLKNEAPAHAPDMKLIETRSRLVFTLEKEEEIDLKIVDDQGRHMKTHYENRSYKPSAQTVVNLHQEAFLPENGTYFLVAEAADGREVARQKIYADGEAETQEHPMRVERHRFNVHLVDALSGANLDVYDALGKKVFSVFANSHFHHGHRSIPVSFKHYRGPGQTFYYRLTDKDGVLVKEVEITSR